VSQLEEKLEALKLLPARPATFRERPTGETFEQRWARSDPAGRRKLMIDSRFEVKASKTAEGAKFSFTIDPGLEARAVAAAAGKPSIHPTHEEIEAASKQQPALEIKGDSADEFMSRLSEAKQALENRQVSGAMPNR
jgi:hypothetical protein